MNKIKTVGELRSVIKDLKDETEVIIWDENGADNPVIYENLGAIHICYVE